MNYELEPGDLINRKGQPAIGVLLKRLVTADGSVCWDYVLRSPNLKSWKPMIGRYEMEEEVIYKKVDEGMIMVHYGTLKNRRVRDISGE